MTGLPRRVKIAFGCVLVATLVIPFVYLQSSVDDSVRAAAINTTSEQIRHQERALNESLLLVRMGRVGHYDDVVLHQKALKGASETLSDLLQPQQDVLNTELAALNEAVSKKLIEVEHVKSHNAVLRNSLHFLPVATKELQTLWTEGDRANPEGAHAAGLLLEELLLVGLDNDGLHQGRAQEQIERLQGFLTESGSDTTPVQSKLGAVLGHARIFLTFHNDLETAMTELLDWSVASRVNAVDAAYVAWRTERATEAAIYRLVLVVMAVVLALSVLLSILFLARYSRRLSESLREKEFQEFALNQHAIVSMTDARGIISYVNQKFCEISQFPREELLGASHRILKTDEHPPEFFTALWKTIASGQVWHGEIKNRKKDGGFYWVASTIVPFADDSGKPFRYVSIRTDISERKRYEEELQRARAEADKAAAAKGNFLANMSHEIRTPMNAIIGMSHLVLASELNPQQRGYVSDIHRAAEGLLGIINDILDFSKIEAGKIEVEQRRFDLGELLAQVQVLVVELAKDTPVEFMVDVPADLPGWVIGDELRLQQILINLLSNAIKFTNEGEVVLRVRAVPADNQRISLGFEVSDTGIGISTEQINLLFTAFNQADASTARKFGGTGLGLAISRQLVHLLGGELQVASVLGKGSTFSFTLPLNRADGGIGVRSSAPMAAHTWATALYVDDSPTACDIAARLAAQLGLELICCPDIEAVNEALTGDALRGKKLDLVLFDWGFGEPTFQSVRQTIESSRPFDACRFIAIAPQRSQRAHGEISGAGADACTHKPLTAGSLFKACANALGEQGPDVEVSEAEARWGVVPELAGVSLLVVEDNAVNQHVLTGFLNHTHATVHLADTGLEALAWLDEHSADLVLMDVQMPGLDGYETTRRLRRDPRFSRLPIIAVTANAMAGDRERARNAGMNDYLAKPIDPEALFRMLMKWLPVDDVDGVVTPAPARQLGNSSEGHSSSAPVPAGVSAGPVFSQALRHLVGFDVDRIMPNLGSVESIFRDVLTVFIANHANEIATLDALKQSGDLGALGARAHALKGVLGSVGAYDAADQAKRLELAARALKPMVTDEAFWALINELEPVLRSATIYLQESGVNLNPDATPHESRSVLGS